MAAWMSIFPAHVALAADDSGSPPPPDEPQSMVRKWSDAFAMCRLGVRRHDKLPLGGVRMEINRLSTDRPVRNNSGSR